MAVFMFIDNFVDEELFDAVCGGNGVQSGMIMVRKKVRIVGHKRFEDAGVEGRECVGSIWQIKCIRRSFRMSTHNSVGAVAPVCCTTSVCAPNFGFHFDTATRC